MIDSALKSVGQNANLVGLATIGGVIALALYAFVLSRWLWRKRVVASSSVRGWRRRNYYRQVKEFRVHDKLIRHGASDGVVAFTAVNSCVNSAALMVLNCTVCLLAYGMHVKTDSEVARIVSFTSLLFVSFKYVDLVNGLGTIQERMLHRFNRSYARQQMLAKLRTSHWTRK